MERANNTFEIIHDQDLIIVVPVTDLRELDFAATEHAAARVFELLEQKHAKHVIIDLSRTDYYGSTALGFFVKLRKRVAEQKCFKSPSSTSCGPSATVARRPSKRCDLPSNPIICRQLLV